MRIVLWPAWSPADVITEDVPTHVTAWCLLYVAFNYRHQVGPGNAVPLVPLGDDPKRHRAADEILKLFDDTGAQVPGGAKGERRLRFEGGRWGMNEEAWEMLLEHWTALQRTRIGASDRRDHRKCQDLLDKTKQLEMGDYDKLMKLPYPPVPVATEVTEPDR